MSEELNSAVIVVPCFPGFYNTIYEYHNDDYYSDYLDDLAEEYHIPLDILTAYAERYDIYDIDYKAYENTVCENFCDAITDRLQDLLDSDTIKLVYREVISPRYYNYTNDKIEADITYSKKDAEAIDQYIADHSDAWKKYLKDHFTSCDGFISFYSNDPEEWDKFDGEIDSVQRRYMLEFILTYVYDDYMDESLYYSTMDSIYSDSYCKIEESFITVLQNKDIKKEIEAYSKELELVPEYLKIMHEQNPDKDYYRGIQEKRAEEIVRIIQLIREEHRLA
jgi:hypothetical protein